jgi:3-phenylpropionate/trans-cinnamate dioxygenase ferredoxin reductase component
MTIVEDWVETFRKGIVYYLRDNYVRGVLSWNTWGLVDKARELIASRQERAPGSLIGSLREDA